MRRFTSSHVLRHYLFGAIVIALATACGDDGDSSAAPDTSSTAQESASTTLPDLDDLDEEVEQGSEPTEVQSTEALPPGQIAGQDDYDDDGEPDPTCETQDFGGGLVLRIPCSIEADFAPEPEAGTTLVERSLYPFAIAPLCWRRGGLHGLGWS